MWSQIWYIRMQRRWGIKYIRIYLWSLNSDHQNYIAVLEWSWRLKIAISYSVRKHLTKGFLCAVLELSGTLWPLLIPKYLGIKRRGTPLPGWRNPGNSHYSDKSTLPFYEPNSKKWLFATLSLIGIILCFVSLEF